MIKSNSSSNIALIKYMGKTDSTLNRPTNSSLSWTIDHLKTFIEVIPTNEVKDNWAPLESEYSINLNEKSINRFLSFWCFLKDHFGIKGKYQIKSANNFPYGCGLASSASSFSALTKAAYKLSLSQGGNELSVADLAALSSQGSGSSCRSFESGWVCWQDNVIKKIDLPYKNLIHKVVVVESGEKKVSSSEAHRLVAGSSLFPGRVERAENRLIQLIQALQNENWRDAYQISWAEFWDMHALFETSKPHFGYMTHETIECLNLVREVWSINSDGPIVTMDAGPNIHFLFRPEQEEFCNKMLNKFFKNFKVL